MAKLTIKKGSTDVTLLIWIANSSSTVGAGLTGLVHDTASLVCYYYRPGAAGETQLSLVTLATLDAAHADGGFLQVDATNMPGLYRLDLSDAVLATGVNSVVVMLHGAANMAPVVLEIDLVAYDPQSATTLGLTNLDAAISTRATPAQVNTEVLDVLNVDTFAEGTAPPAATCTIVARLQWMGKLNRNLIEQTADTQTLYADDGTTPIAESAHSDAAGTYTRGEWSAP